MSYDRMALTEAAVPLIAAVTGDADTDEWTLWREMGITALVFEAPDRPDPAHPGHVSATGPSRSQPYLWRLSVADARETWEVLATRGLIPMSWIDDPTRRFVQPSRVLAPHPPTVRDALVVASVWQTMLDLEAQVREAFNMTGVVWRVAGHFERARRSVAPERGWTDSQRAVGVAVGAAGWALESVSQARHVGSGVPLATGSGIGSMMWIRDFVENGALRLACWEPGT